VIFDGSVLDIMDGSLSVLDGVEEDECVTGPTVDVRRVDHSVAAELLRDVFLRHVLDVPEPDAVRRHRTTEPQLQTNMTARLILVFKLSK